MFLGQDVDFNRIKIEDKTENALEIDKMRMENIELEKKIEEIQGERA